MDDYRDSIKHYYEAHINPTLLKVFEFIGFDEIEERAEGAYVYDRNGKAYLDFLASFGALNFGHRHPRIVQAVKNQLDKMPLSSKVFLNAVQAELARRLAEMTPGDLQCGFFTNSGAEAVECALKVARAYRPQRPGVVYFSNSFHGKTLGALSVTGRDSYRQPFLPLMPGFKECPLGDMKSLLRTVDEDTIGILIEPIQGEGGIVVPPPGFLNELREFCDYWGFLLIADEIQTGFGRTGRNFAVEWDDVAPDIMTLGKSLGGGVMPIGACIAREEVWHLFKDNPLIHSSTLGGNPLACAAGLAAIEVLTQENLAARANERGKELMAGLQRIQTAYSDLIHTVRGRGLMAGVEFNDPEITEFAIILLRQKGILTAYALNNQKVLRLEPPLIITSEQIAEFLKALEDSMAEARNLKSEIEVKEPVTGIYQLEPMSKE
ncbi:MAG: aspartate aminotransferase family protein [bacterium]